MWANLCEPSNDGKNQSRSTDVKLRSQVYLFEPLTWLEAAIFFLFAIQEDPENAGDWGALARHRWEQYETTRGALNPLATKLGALSL